LSFNALLSPAGDAAQDAADVLGNGAVSGGFVMSWDFGNGSASITPIGAPQAVAISGADFTLNFKPWSAPGSLPVVRPMEIGFLGHSSAVAVNLGLGLDSGTGAVQPLFGWSGTVSDGVESLTLRPQSDGVVSSIGFVLTNNNTGANHAHSDPTRFQFFRAEDSSGLFDMEFVLMRIDADGSGSFDDGWLLMSQAPLSTIPEPSLALLVAGIAAGALVVLRRRRSDRA